jgi:hypothetical protein
MGGMGGMGGTRRPTVVQGDDVRYSTLRPFTRLFFSFKCKVSKM